MHQLTLQYNRLPSSLLKACKVVDFTDPRTIALLNPPDDDADNYDSIELGVLYTDAHLIDQLLALFNNLDIKKQWLDFGYLSDMTNLGLSRLILYTLRRYQKAIPGSLSIIVGEAL